MNVLNRSISNYSPRLLPLFLHEGHHQVILDTTSGTIIYCLILAIIIASEVNENFPPMAGGLANLFGIFFVFLFIWILSMPYPSVYMSTMSCEIIQQFTTRYSENCGKGEMLRIETSKTDEMDINFLD